MTEERKIQLGVTAKDEATPVFDKIGQGAQKMGQTVSQAGEVAGKGLDKIPDGAKRASDGFTREEGRLRGAIQRATLDLQTFGKTASQRYEATIDFKGFDRAKFEPLLAAFREAEEAQRELQRQQAGTQFLDALAAQAAALREQVALQKMSADEVARYKAAQLGVSGAVEPLIADLQKARAAQEALTEQTRMMADAQRGVAALLGRRNSFLDGLKQQADSIGKTRADLLELQAAQLGLTAQAAPYIAKLREAEQGHQKLGAGAKLNAFQMQQLGFQMHDFAVQVFSGQSALTAFVQQGSQLSGTFGGAKNAFQAVLSLITPMRAAMIGAAAAVGGLAVALTHAETAARGLNTVQAQLAGTGRGEMFSTAGLKEFIEQLSQAPGVSRESATAIVSELSKVKDIGGALFRDLAGAAADYAKATGTDVPTAARALARAFADPAKGAKELDEALGALSSSQLLQIERLTKMGDTAGAQRVLFEALQGSIKGLASNAMTPLQKAVDDLGNSWERALRQLDQSQGLRTLNALLADTVKAVQFLVDNAGKLGGLGNIGVASVPGIGLPSAVGNGVIAAARSALGLEKPKNPTATGKVTEAGAAPVANAAQAAVRTDKDRDEDIKKALEAGKAYKSQAGEIADLTKQRDQFNKALKESIALYGKDSEQAKRLREAVSGVNERIASVSKRGAGGNEAQQVLDAQLQQILKASQDSLAKEREAFAFSERFLQGVFQAGNLSVRDFYDQRRQAIEQGVTAELQALAKEREAVLAHMEATKRTSPKDASALVADQTRLQDIDNRAERLRLDSARQQVLANQEAEASFKQLNDQVLNYKASLLQLQGDEEGAARIRAQIAIEQAQLLARQSGGNVDVDGLRRASDQSITLTTTRRQISDVQTRQQMREERISQEQRNGGMTTLESLAAVSDSRRQAIAQLEELVRAQEEVAKTRPKDYQLQIDTERARHELELLKGEVDVLGNQFREMFKDAGSNFFNDLMSGKGLKGALKGFGEALSREINGVVSRELSEQLFGKNGALGGAGGALADLFGGESRKKAADPALKAAQDLSKPTIDTQPVQTSLNSLSAGMEPATQALLQLTNAANAASGALQQRAPLPPGIQDVQITRDPVANVVAGDSGYSYHDYGATSGEQSVMEMFKAAERSTEDYAKSNATAGNALLQLASAAGKGGGALSMLPGIINAVQAAAQASAATSSGSSGGGAIGSIISAFASGGSSFTMNGGYTPDPSYSYHDYGAFSEGGFTGVKGEKEVAGVVHGQEYVFSAPAVRAIGLERLERLHKKAKTGKDVEDEVPGYSDGGYVTVAGASRPQTLQSGNRYLLALQAPPVKAGDTYVTNHHNNIAVQAAPGMTRETAMQIGTNVRRGLAVSARNGR